MKGVRADHQVGRAAVFELVPGIDEDFPVLFGGTGFVVSLELTEVEGVDEDPGEVLSVGLVPGELVQESIVFGGGVPGGSADESDEGHESILAVFGIHRVRLRRA